MVSQTEAMGMVRTFVDDLVRAEKAIQEAERFLKRIGQFLKEQGDL